MGASHVDWTTRVTHAVPAGQPEGVAQIAQRLFPAYRVDGGRTHLAGCTLDERLYARLRYQSGQTAVGIYVDADGQELSATEADALGLEYMLANRYDPHGAISPSGAVSVNCGASVGPELA